MVNPKRIAVIPALNEEGTIGAVIKAAKDYADEVIVVDDASTDGTAIAARENGATVTSHHNRQGYDRAIGDGFAMAVKNKADIIVTLDADGQHLPLDIPRLTQPIEEGNADIVVGRRGRHARVSEWLFAAIAKVVLRIDDPLCGFKAYDVEVYRAIGHFDTLSSIGTQLIFSAGRKGYRLAQVDIGLKTRGDIPRFGKSVVANYKILKALARILVLLMTG